jgi:hypothetical protein
MLSNFIIVVLSTWCCENATYSKCGFALMIVTVITYWDHKVVRDFGSTPATIPS